MQTAVRSSTALPLAAYLNPLAMLRNLRAHAYLTWQMSKREVQARYRGTRLGLLWAVLTPLILLSIYTFVFAVVFRNRWGTDPDETRGHFALTMFCGILLYNIFAEVVARSPGMVVGSPNYVKKLVFPVEVFVPAGVITALINFLLGCGVWIVGWLLLKWTWPQPTLLYLPLVVLPVVLLALGMGWILASVGVFLRDVGPAVSLAVQMLFFLTPIFYRLEVVPQPYRTFIALNPLAHAVEDVRRVMMFGEPPAWVWWSFAVVASGALAVLGYAFFMKSRRAFADVL